MEKFQSEENTWKVTSREELDQAFNALFTRDSMKTISLLSFLKRTIYQFNLKNFSPEDILLEVYYRGFKYISSGGEINHLNAWVRSTAYNYVRELRRRETRNERLIEKSTFQEYYSSPIAEVESYLEILRSAFEELSQKDKEILSMRIIDNLSWQEIQEFYRNRNENISPESLRQRGSRALRRLREIYREKESKKS